MNIPNPVPNPITTPVVAPAIPWYQSPVQIAQIVAFITAIAAIVPNSKIVQALGLVDPIKVNGYVTEICGVVAISAIIWGLIARQLSNVQKLTFTKAQAKADTSTQATAIVQQAMAQKSIPTVAVVKDTLDAKAAAVKSTSNLSSFFIALLLVAPFVSLAIVTACTATPATTQTFNQIVVTTEGTDDAAVKAVSSLLSQGVIKPADAAAAQKITDQISAALQIANTAFVAGNESTADAKIAAAASAVIALQACLVSGAKTPVLTCLQGITLP